MFMPLRLPAILDGDPLVTGTLYLNYIAGGVSGTNIRILPTGAAITQIGDAGSTSHTLNANDDLFVAGRLETDGIFYCDNTGYFNYGVVFAQNQGIFFNTTLANGSIIVFNTTLAHWIFGVNTVGNKVMIISDYTNQGKNHDHALQTDPTLYVHSITDPDTDNTEYATVKWNTMEISGDNGSFFSIKSVTETITIANGQGAGGVASTNAMAPANSLILGVCARVTQAPGGGATAWDLAITGGTAEGLLKDIAVALSTTANSATNATAAQTFPIRNGSATTLTLTTDNNVTGASMIVRLVTYYMQFTAPTG